MALALLVGAAVPACRRAPELSGGRLEEPVDRFPIVKGLPDPFVLQDGRRASSMADWQRRRGELRELMLRHEYGHLPPAPGSVTGVEVSREALADGVVKRRVRLSLGPARGVTFDIGLLSPPAKARSPAIVHIDHRGSFAATYAPEVAKHGYLVAGYDPTALDPDQPDTVGPAQAAFPGHDWATLAVWAWGAMRVADYLVTLPEVDRAKLIVTGHSRSGKAALLAGALDERFAIVAPQGSGAGGSATYRVRGESSEGLAEVTGNFPHWFQPGLRRFAGHEERLPFDQHFLAALVAPRGLVTLDALGDLWANVPGTQQSYLAALPVYEALGAGDRLAIVFRGGQHEQSDDEWRALLDFADKLLLGKDTPPGRRFDQLPYPDRPKGFGWTAPKLR
jgi:hypothetical protein